MRVIAIDWSGENTTSAARRVIWLAEVRDGRLIRLENGRARPELTDHLVNLAGRDKELIVGLDFAFSFPAWFLEERGLETGSELWKLAEEEGEDWLTACPWPFWGRGSTKPRDLPEEFRVTEKWASECPGVDPKSVFQLVGPGHVGTGSIRGMPHLLELQEAGFSIWPFDPARLPLVIEIYPRFLAPELGTNDPPRRRRYLEVREPNLAAEFVRKAIESPHAFDALVSALAMDRHREALLRQPNTDEVAKLEGAIWHPEQRTPTNEQMELPTPPSPRHHPLAHLLDAATFGAERHRDQRRKDEDASPYINHPLEVARLLAREGGVTDLDMLLAAVLHNTIEDTETSAEELEERFGARVRRLVEEVTDDKSLPKAERKWRQVEGAPHLSGDAKRIKLADNIANVTDVTRTPPTDWSLERRREYLDWTERVVEACRGVSPALERLYDERLAEGRAVIESEPE